MRVLVAGGGGFIGGHLVTSLISAGHDVIVADIKPLHMWDQVFDGSAVTNYADMDLAELANCRFVTDGVDEVYMLAADMGGMGFIENNKLACMLSVLPSTHMLLASAENSVKRFFYASSACVYAADKQRDPRVVALRESDAYPAEPEDGYGWEKLFTERMCRHFMEEAGLAVRVARFHNVYGPWGTYEGGREKAPAAICRKVAEAVLSGDHSIEIWGDGKQTRSFMYVDDCVRGINRIMGSSCVEPLNLGSSELVSVNDLVSTVEDIAGVRLKMFYDLSAPQGVRGRNSDNSLLVRATGWEPSVRLREGLEVTYSWIFDQVKSSAKPMFM